MAARIPTAADLGFNDPRAVSGDLRYPANDPVATGMSTLGQGLDKASTAAFHIANVQEDKRQALNEATSTTDFVNKLVPLVSSISQETDIEKIAEKRKQLDTLLPDSANAIDDPQRKALWLSRHANAILHAQAQADERITTLDRANYYTGIEKQLDALVESAGKSPDPKAFDIAKLAGQQLIDAAGKYGIGAQALYQKQKQFEHQLDTAGTQALGEAAANWALGLGPAPVSGTASRFSGDSGERVAATLKARGWSDAAITGALNNSITESSLNPNATGAAGEKGLFQFHPNSHIGPFTQAYKGDWSPEAQASYVADVVDQSMPGYAQSNDAHQATAQFLRGFEKPKDQGEGQLNARLANSGASQSILARAAAIPTAPAQGVNTGNDAAQPGAQGGGALRNRTGLLSLSEQLDKIQGLPIPDAAKEIAWRRAKDKYTAMEADAARAERLRAAQERQISESAEATVIADKYSPTPQLTAGDVSRMPGLSNEAKLRMIHYLGQDNSDVDPALAKQTERQLVSDIVAGKITDSKPIFDAFIGKQLREQEFNFVRKQLDDFRTPEGEKILKLIDQTVKTLEPQIDKSNPLMGKIDHDGKTQLGLFAADLREMVDDARKAGKSPTEIKEMLNPRRFLNDPNLLAPYRKTMQQSMQSLRGQVQGLTGQPVVQPARVANPLVGGEPVATAPIPPPSATVTMAPNPFVAPAEAAPPTPAAPGIIPRQPGESLSDYVKRTGVGALR